MKKEYVKPLGQIVVMCVNENIATSGGTNNNPSELFYNYDLTGNRKYIAFSAIEASNTGNPQVDKYADLMSAHINGVYFICSTGNGGISPH